jgi:hypothetical protein
MLHGKQKLSLGEGGSNLFVVQRWNSQEKSCGFLQKGLALLDELSVIQLSSTYYGTEYNIK